MVPLVAALGGLALGAAAMYVVRSVHRRTEHAERGVSRPPRGPGRGA